MRTMPEDAAEPICHCKDVPSNALDPVPLGATTVKQITKISAHRVTLDSGTTIPWSWSASTSDGYVEMEEAGTNTSFASADDFETD